MSISVASVRTAVSAFALTMAVGCMATHQRDRPEIVASQQAQITVVLPARPEQVVPRVMKEFLDHQLEITSSQPNLIEAKLPHETTLLGGYDITARAIIVSLDTGTQVTLYGEETRHQGAMPVATYRVSQYARGRAREVWGKLDAIAKSLAPDSIARRN